MDFVRFWCQKCQTRLEVPASLATQRLIECPRCGQIFPRSAVGADFGASASSAEPGPTWERSPARSGMLARAGVAVLALVLAVGGVGAAVAAMMTFKAEEPRRSGATSAPPAKVGPGNMPGPMRKWMNKGKGMQNGPWRRPPANVSWHQPEEWRSTLPHALALQDPGMAREVMHRRA
jgi:hypothetical protein